MWITTFVIAAIVTLVPFLIIVLLLPGIRTMIFKNGVMPGVKHFLQITAQKAKSSFSL